jgi:hypothetical protein
MLSFKFRNYPRKVALSSSQRERYYIFSENVGFHARGKQVPTKYRNELGKYVNIVKPYHLNQDKVVPIAWHKGTDKKLVLGYSFDTEHNVVEELTKATEFTTKQAGNAVVVLANKKTLEPILANPRAANTAKYVTINGNYLYQGGNGFVRKKIVDTLREYFTNQIKDQYSTKIIVKQPLHITYTFNTQYGGVNWDLDNHAEFYTKVLQDVLRDLVIGDDTILTIRGKTVMFNPIPDDEIPFIVVEIKTIA